jgi:hypothetical protein
LESYAKTFIDKINFITFFHLSQNLVKEMTRGIKIDVRGYEDYLDAQNNVVTHYVVNILSSGLEYQLRKRYSEFAMLLNATKERCPGLANFQFPNKSIFHTYSDFTKERRRQAFEVELNILLAMDPPLQFLM